MGEESLDLIRPYLRAVQFLVDVGAGIRPQTLIRAERTLCVEPHGEYADWLRDAGHCVMHTTALDALRRIAACDSVVALDVIEHMERAEGEAFVRLALEKAREQVVIFTPLGFMEQHGDAWGMHGEHWQEHRSGWTPEDFPHWKVLTLPGFHAGHDAFFAVHG